VLASPWRQCWLHFVSSCGFTLSTVMYNLVGSCGYTFAAKLSTVVATPCRQWWITWSEVVAIPWRQWLLHLGGSVGFTSYHNTVVFTVFVLSTSLILPHCNTFCLCLCVSFLFAVLLFIGHLISNENLQDYLNSKIRHWNKMIGKCLK